MKSYPHIRLLRFIASMTMALVMLMPWSGFAAAKWWPIQVKSYYGEYVADSKTPGHAAPSLGRAKLEEWTPPEPPDKQYTLGVCIPHIKDSYWVAVNYGIIEEARRLGVSIRLLEAGGYEKLDRQQEQIRELIRDDVDGIILGSISYKGNDNDIKDAVEAGIPVVEVINDVHAPAVSAKALVSFHEMGYFAGEFLAEQAEKQGLNSVSIAFFPGPKDSGWAPETLEGFMEAMDYFPGQVGVWDISWGDTSHAVQRKLLLDSLKSVGPVDYVVGNAVAAEVAPDILAELGWEECTSVVSTYMIPALFDKILNRQVAGAPSDLTVFQGRMAINMMVRILNGEKPGKDFPFRSGPFIPMITPNNISRYPFKGLFGPRDFQPLFALEP